MSHNIKVLTELANFHRVYDIAKVVLEDSRFSIWSGSSKPHSHHYGRGGLAQHVKEVVQLCEDNNTFFHHLGKGVDKKKLFLAALFHDAGKMWDYRPKDGTYLEWEAIAHKDLIHHISRSALVWNQAATAANWSEDDKDEVTHCILSHHGMREWGSPVQPRTRMAWLLHLCDGISARMDDCDKRNPFSLDPIKK